MTETTPAPYLKVWVRHRDVPSPVRNLATTTATATRTFKNQFVYTIPDSQVSLVEMKAIRYTGTFWHRNLSNR